MSAGALCGWCSIPASSLCTSLIQRRLRAAGAIVGDRVGVESHQNISGPAPPEIVMQRSIARRMASGQKMLGGQDAALQPWDGGGRSRRLAADGQPGNAAPLGSSADNDCNIQDERAPSALVSRPEATGPDRLLATLARHGRFAATATHFSSAYCTTRALNSLLAALCSTTSSPTFLCVAPYVLLRAAPHVAPDATTFRILTSALCLAQRPSAAGDLLRCMPGLFLDPDPRHSPAVLASLCRCSPARNALAFLDDMRRWVVSPPRSDHHAVLDALLREGMAAQAYEVVAKQMDDEGVSPGLPEFERVLRRKPSVCGTAGALHARLGGKDVGWGGWSFVIVTPG
ncbi:hypothetical protein SETIT_3G090100v2 [Setaria italica]|uniref:Pentacotripeptide-repeat region of PRORP domain-containing protein n=1 Tax=Setaria italica TaxID=4555 RepID=A0A368QF00_SETIT|nr:hypothetical protein SETIT_3G090100v2 [Setaria italica]